MRGMLFEVQGFHPGLVALTSVILTAVVLAATLVPSQRAARVSPLEALRED